MNFNFTKSLIKPSESSTVTNSNFNKMTELNRMERIHDNMAGINPYTKERNDKISNNKEPIKDVQTNQLREQIITMNSLKKD